MSNYIRFVVQGNSVSVSNNSLRHINKWETYENEDKMSETEKEWKGLIRRGRRRINTFLKMVGIIKDKPDCFISIVFPTKYRKAYLKDRKVILRKFRRAIRLKFKDGWFVTKIEWGYNSWIHMHLIGSFSKNHAVTRKEKTELVKIWKKYVGSNDRSLVDIKKYHDQTTYLAMKKLKRHKDAFCIRILKNDLSMSYINDKNITFYEKEIKRFDRFIMLIFQYKYLRAAISKGHKPDSIIEQFRKKDFHVTAFDNMHIQRIINETESEYANYKILIRNGKYTEEEIELNILKEFNNYLLSKGIDPYLREADLEEVFAGSK